MHVLIPYRVICIVVALLRENLHQFSVTSAVRMMHHNDAKLLSNCAVVTLT